jgi:flagellar protein FlaH
MGETYRLQIPRDDLHDQLGQGLPAGTITLIEGADGTGKSALIQRMIYGFLANQYSVTCISTEFTVRDFINQMYSLDYPISSWLLNGKLKFVPVYPLIGKTTSRKDFLGMLMGSQELFKSDLMIIDTFSSLVSNSLEGEENSIRVLGFFKRLAGMGKSIVLTVDPGEVNPKALAPFESDSHVYLSIVVSQVGGMISRSIMVKRFASTEYRVSPMIGFRIEPNVGMVIEITSVV